MGSSTLAIAIDFPKYLVTIFSDAFEKGTQQAARMLWSVLISILKEHWFAVISVLFLVLVAVTFKAMMGRWGSLGSFLYNALYFGTLFIIGLIWGPEIFVNDIFNAACTAILYPVCYLLVGYILDKTGLRYR